MRTKYHVTQRPDGNWQSKKTGGERASAVASTKEELVSKAAAIAKSLGNSQVIIHKANGMIQSERTYDNDPNPPNG